MTAKRIEGSLRGRQDNSGVEYVEEFDVDGLVAIDLLGRVDEALNDAGVPAMGSAAIIAGVANPAIVVTDKTAVPNGVPSSMRVTVTYKTPNNDNDNPKLNTTGVLSFFSSVSTETVREDKNGAILETSWSGPVTAIFPESASVLTIGPIGYKGTAEVDRPRFSFSLRRRESSIALIKQRAEDFVGLVNSLTWSGFPPKTILCTGIELTEQGDELRADYRFVYKPDDFDFDLIARINGRIPFNVSTGVNGGITVYSLYDEIDFNALPVSF